MYDVVIIGAGPAGLFSAYELCKNNKNLKILEKEDRTISGKTANPEGLYLKNVFYR